MSENYETNNQYMCPKTGRRGCECRKAPNIYGHDFTQIDYFQKLQNTEKINFKNNNLGDSRLKHEVSKDTPGFLALRYQQPM